MMDLIFHGKNIIIRNIGTSQVSWEKGMYLFNAPVVSIKVFINHVEAQI